MSVRAQLLGRGVLLIPWFHYTSGMMPQRSFLLLQYDSDAFMYDPNAFRYDFEAFVYNIHTFHYDFDAFMQKL